MASSRPQLGIFAGRALPHGVSSTDDIFTLWGFGIRNLSAKPIARAAAFSRFRFYRGNGSNVHWGGLSIDASLQAPFGNFDWFGRVGLDVTQYSSDTTSTKVVSVNIFSGV